MLKVAFVSKMCKVLKKSPKETRENPLLTLPFFGHSDVMNIRKVLRFHASARRLLKLAFALIVFAHPYCARKFMSHGGRFVGKYFWPKRQLRQNFAVYRGR